MPPRPPVAFIWISKLMDNTSPKYIKDEERGIIEKEFWPKALSDFGLLFDKNRHLLGIEVLQASAYLDSDLLNGED